MIRYLLYRFIPYYFILLLIIGSFLFISSETGLRIIWNQVRDRLPENVQVQHVSGKLLDRVHLKGLHYQADGMDVAVREAWLQWSPSALLQGKIQIDDITILGSRIAAQSGLEDQPKSTQKPLAELPSLPDILIKKWQVRELEWSTDGVSRFQLYQAHLNARLIQQQLDLHLREFDSRETGPLLAELDGDIQAKGFEVRRLKLSSPAPVNSELSLSGRCTWPSLDCLAALKWQNLQWPLQSDAQVSSAEGETEFSWTTAKRQLLVRAMLAGQQLPPSQLELSADWQADQEQWQLAADWQQSEGAAARVQLAAAFDPKSSQFNTNIHPDNVDLSSWLADWPSRLGGQVEIEGELQPALRVQANKIDLSGAMREQPFTLKAKGNFNHKQWSVEGLQLNWANNTLTGHLRHRSTWNGSLMLNAKDLAALDPKLAGSIITEAKIQGNSQIPQVNWQASVNQLRWQDSSLQRLDSEGEFSEDRLQANIVLMDLEAGGLSIPNLRIQSQGSLAMAVTEIDLSESRGQGRALISTQWDPKRGHLSADISDAQWKSLMGSESHSWMLNQGGQLHWQAANWQLENQCWQSDQSSVCAQAAVKDGRVQGRLVLNDYPLGRLKSQLPIGSRLDGIANMQLTIAESPMNNPKLDLKLNTSSTRVSRTLGDDEFELLRFAPGEIQAKFENQGLAANISFPLEQADSKPIANSGIWGAANLSAERAVDLRLNLMFDDIGVIAAFSPEILKADGALKGRINLAGSLPDTTLDAQLALGPASISLDQPNLQLQDLNLNLSTQADQSIQLSGGFRSGPGRLVFNGQLEDWRRKPRLKATLAGEDVLVMNTTEARVIVSPDLSLDAQLPELKLRGEVLVSEAQIQPQDLSQSGAIAPVEDQFIVGEDQTESKGLQIDSELSLALGQDVSIEAMGLTSHIRGKLTTRLKPGKVTTAVGKLSLIDGRYKAYGQDLRIEKGELIFSGGPVTEPGLDLKAYRQARVDVRAGVIVRGPIRNPRVSLYSDPDMRETDQLSYLVLGRAAESQSDEDQAALNNAALALGLKGSDLLAKQFKSQLGLDEVSIGTQAGQNANQASLVLGKYLSPDIYVSYGVGLFEPVYTFKLRYQLSRHWTLQTESGIESGGDLFYTIER